MSRLSWNPAALAPSAMLPPFREPASPAVLWNGVTYLRDVSAETDRLIQSLNRLRTPMINETRTVIRRSEELGNAAADVQALQASQRELETIIQRFKQLSGALVPLGEQSIVLGAIRSDLTQAEQVSVPVPGWAPLPAQVWQGTNRGRSTTFSMPVKASSKVIVRS